MNQEKKKKIAANVMPILKKYNMKGTLSVRNNSTIVLRLTSGKIDFAADLTQKPIDNIRQRYNFDVNPYWWHEHYRKDTMSHKFLSEILPALKSAEWYDKSDIQVDYFNTAYYIDVSIGKWDAPYTLTP